MANKDPATIYPATEDPATEDPATKYPATKDPATKDPATEDPANEDPATKDPATEDPATSNTCSAYEELKKHLETQYNGYQMLHRKREIGKMKGMYEEIPLSDTVYKPSNIMSSFLRGGIIDSVAYFEEFLMKLLVKVRDTLDKCKHKKDESDRNIQNGSYLHFCSSINKHYLPLTTLYEQTLPGFKTKLFEKPIHYHHLIDDKNISVLKIDKHTMCALFRLSYGIRCVMAHGDPKRTLENKGVMTKEKFPICQENCGTPVDEKLSNINKISQAFDSLNKDDVLRTSRKYPDPTPLESLPEKNNEQEKAIQHIKNIFENVKDVKEGSNNDLGGEYALFHLFRIGHWLREGKRDMYITFNMMMRINQIISVLAHRIYITVARILIEKTREPRIWGVTEADVGTLIENFTEEHKKKVEGLQKIQSASGTCEKCGKP